MKRVTMTFLICTIMVTLVACANNNETIPTTKEHKQTEESFTEPSQMDNTDVQYAMLIPNPKEVFKNGNITVIDEDGGDAYIFNITGYTVEEFDSYVSSCKEKGFTDISYETDTERAKDFGAYSSDGKYWTQVNLDKENNIIYVICQTSKNK